MGDLEAIHRVPLRLGRAVAAQGAERVCAGRSRPGVLVPVG